ncbi:hypothetical protein [Roseimaritima sediminicola]|uniref:hypothetical protein n=1 Tax=Roseimaritima sediminicola TaxID=2662066 RepID=UPI0012984EA7|nr:hypothetical protein [Roseimaritima sediminicola]
MNEPQKSRIDIARVPWQLWVVIALLAAEGIGNSLIMFGNPVAAIWLAAKVLFIMGLIRRWRIVFVLFAIVAALHVLAFASSAPFISFLNLLILVLAISQYRRFFPDESRSQMAGSTEKA